MLLRYFHVALISFLCRTEKTLISAQIKFSKASTTRECFLQNQPLLDCSNERYESLDGTCNNPLNPYDGKSQTPFKRLLPPAYGNKLNGSRRAANDEPLPSARLVSNAFNGKRLGSNPNSSVVNGMFVQFGQYITHDLTGAPTQNEENGKPVDCNCLNPSPSCINIGISPSDPFYENKVTCIMRKGSLKVSGCESFPAEQINKLSAYIDAETVYGWNEELLSNLRVPDSEFGEMRLMASEEEMMDPKLTGCPFQRKRRLLPTLNDIKSNLAKQFDCPAHLQSPVCFAAGDSRVNENIGLVSTHLIFTREHNRIAKRLKVLNPNWDGEKIFQETRRILIAMHQMITYNEFLPLLLGPKLMKKFDLNIVRNGFYFGYDVTYDATISNAFASAAFRYGHSQVGMFYHRLKPDYVQKEASSIRTFEGLFFQEAVSNGTTPGIMRGLMVDPARKTDLQFVEDLRNRMFESATQVGQDLLAINIQRGRSHGIPSYNEYRDFCGLSKIFVWTDLLSEMPLRTVLILQRVYNNVDDIDLFVGGIAETPLPGANVGHTFGCIIGYQFRDLRKGDRYWFENPGQFSESQLNELRKVTFSSVLCNNMEGMETISMKSMELEGELNRRIPCSQVPQIKLESWQEYYEKQDGVWSRWFPSEQLPGETLLQKILTLNPESVCNNPLKVETEQMGKDSKKTKTRFYCPMGSITNGGYPNTKENLNYYWTVWFDRDSPNKENPNDVESFEILKAERPSEICDNPLYIQAKTKHGENAFDSSEVFASLRPGKGLVCYGSEQESGICKDYRVRFYCPKDQRELIKVAKYNVSKLPINKWTPWINVGNPKRGSFDMETIDYAKRAGHFICSRPLQIEARVSGTNVTAADTGDVLRRFNVYHGLICDNADQVDGYCQDYEVRYLCPASSYSRRNTF